MKKRKDWTIEQKKTALWEYVKSRFGIEIPRQKVCETHEPPFEFFAAAFFEFYPVILALGPRLGGKTLDFAILSICEAIADPDCELANFGAVEKQAMRCYGYMQRFFENTKRLQQFVDGKVTLSKTKLKNKSWIQVLVATMAGVNSPHPQKLKADEVELIPWNILQEAFNMPQSTTEINATTVLGSTRKFAHGPMQRLIDNKIAKVFTFCIWEVMEPWPTDRDMQQRIIDGFIDKYGNADMLPKDTSKFNGFFRWQDLLQRISTLDEETFRAQVLCEKPDSGGLIYPKFDEILNFHKGFEIDRSGKTHIQIWEDFGYARPDHPDAVAFVQVNMEKMEFTIFDELWLFEHGTQDIIVEIIQKLQEWKLVPPELMEIDKQRLLSYRPEGSPMINYAEFFRHIPLWIPDYHGLTEIKDRQKYGCPIPMQYKVTHDMLHPNCMNPKTCELKNIAEMYQKENGIPHVRKFVDDRRFKITEKPVNIRDNFLAYSKKRRPDGTWSDEPEKKDDHGPDLVHYGTVYNWPSLAYQSLSPETYELPTEGYNSIGGEDIAIGGTYTGGLHDKTF